MTALFTPIAFKNLNLRNRIGVSPMCQYSSTDGFATDWHLVHIGSRAVGGAGLIVMEATGVLPEGRITPGCLGIWNDAHIEKLKQITDFCKSHGAAMGIQLAHAGRKASCDVPWRGGKTLQKNEGGWQPVAPSPVAFKPQDDAPYELTGADIAQVTRAFADAARRAVAAGFQLVEIHAAHGYLLHSFLSPLSNKRADAYGGSLENRMRLLLEVTRVVRAAVSKDTVIAVRLSCSDWAEGGLTIDDTVKVSMALKNEGVDFIDCSSGGLTADAKIQTGPGYQVPFSDAIRNQAGIATAAVGMITEARQAEEILQKGQADLIFLARAELHDPYWPIHAAEKLGATPPVPDQYLRGFPKTT